MINERTHPPTHARTRSFPCARMHPRADLSVAQPASHLLKLSRPTHRNNGNVRKREGAGGVRRVDRRACTTHALYMRHFQTTFCAVIFHTQLPRGSHIQAHQQHWAWTDIVVSTYGFSRIVSRAYIAPCKRTSREKNKINKTFVAPVRLDWDLLSQVNVNGVDFGIIHFLSPFFYFINESRRCVFTHCFQKSAAALTQVHTPPPPPPPPPLCMRTR